MVMENMPCSQLFASACLVYSILYIIYNSFKTLFIWGREYTQQGEGHLKRTAQSAEPDAGSTPPPRPWSELKSGAGRTTDCAPPAPASCPVASLFVQPLTVLWESKLQADLSLRRALQASSLLMNCLGSDKDPLAISSAWKITRIILRPFLKKHRRNPCPIPCHFVNGKSNIRDKNSASVLTYNMIKVSSFSELLKYGEIRQGILFKLY